MIFVVLYFVIFALLSIFTTGCLNDLKGIDKWDYGFWILVSLFWLPLLAVAVVLIVIGWFRSGARIVIQWVATHEQP